MADRIGAHVTPEQLVDAADGVQDAAVVRHLASCEPCSDRLAELRALMSSVAAADEPVPEPSPLFWNHFQQRVVEAVHAERRNESIPTRAMRMLRPAILVPVAAALIVAVGVIVSSRWRGADSTPAAPQIVAVAPRGNAAAAANSDTLRDTIDEDPSLQLIADLTADMDWSAVDAAGFTPSGSADHAVSHLDVQDLKELQRLLRAELGS
jgi:hypothetical protein